MGMPNATLWPLTDSIEICLKISFHLPTTVMRLMLINRTDYQLIDISEDGFMEMKNYIKSNGYGGRDKNQMKTKMSYYVLRLPTNENLLGQIKRYVACPCNICALKDIGPKN